MRLIELCTRMATECEIANTPQMVRALCNMHRGFKVRSCKHAKSGKDPAQYS